MGGGWALGGVRRGRWRGRVSSWAGRQGTPAMRRAGEEWGGQGTPSGVTYNVDLSFCHPSHALPWEAPASKFASPFPADFLAGKAPISNFGDRIK